MKNKLALLITVLVLMLGSGAIGYYLKSASPLPKTPGNPKGVACTMEAKLCPDGTSVGRIPPDCEFAPCPVNGIIEEPSPGPIDPACIDHLGNPRAGSACGDMPPEARACSSTNDCLATCSRGCVSATWLSQTSPNDCAAMPEYTCTCTNGFCIQEE